MALATEKLTGFTREAVVELSRLRNEPQWMADWRLAAWDVYESLPMPQRNEESGRPLMRSSLIAAVTST